MDKICIMFAPNMWSQSVVEGIFCIFCALFCVNRDGMASLVNKPFCSWNKFHEKCKNHGSSKIHHQSMLAAETFVNSIEHPELGLLVQWMPSA